MCVCVCVCMCFFLAGKIVCFFFQNFAGPPLAAGLHAMFPHNFFLGFFPLKVTKRNVFMIDVTTKPYLIVRLIIWVDTPMSPPTARNFNSCLVLFVAFVGPTP